jgi:hypothetical protein
MSSETIFYNNISPPIPPTSNEEQNDNLLSQIITNDNDKFEPGEFLYISELHSREMLVNAWNAITQLEIWDYMKKDTCSYTFNNDNEIDIISRKMEELGYNGHSGFSFGWTMRQMQIISKIGEIKYRQEILCRL